MTESKSLKLLSLIDLGLYHPSAQMVLELQQDHGWALYYSVWGNAILDQLRYVVEISTRKGDAGAALVTFNMDALPGSTISHHVSSESTVFIWAKEGRHPTKYFLHPDARD